MNKKHIISALMLSIAIFIMGCSGLSIQGKAGVNSKAEIPKLNTPADTPMNTVSVGYHDMAFSEYHNAIVTPYVEEYVFSMNGTLATVYPILGEDVKAGDLLAELDHSDIDAEISALQIEIVEIEESLSRIIDEATAILEQLNERKANILSGKLKVSNTSGEIAVIDSDIAFYEAKLANANESLTITLEGPVAQLARLEEKLSDYRIYAPFDGRVIYITDETEMNKRTTAIALADTTRKYLQTDYVVESYIKRAAKLYATLDDKTYPLQYVPLDNNNDNPNLKSAKGLLTYFVISDGSISSIEYGRRMLVTIDTEYIENVLSIPNTTLFTDENGMPFVYIVDENGVRTRQDIVIGETDNIYTAVIDGLKEGDVVYVPN